MRGDSAVLLVFFLVSARGFYASPRGVAVRGNHSCRASLVTMMAKGGKGSKGSKGGKGGKCGKCGKCGGRVGGRTNRKRNL